MPLDSAPFVILRSVLDVRRWRETLSDPTSLGFVPTMGALHHGHLQLVTHSLSSQRHTIVSIFLNPTQFGPSEDLASYPSTLQADLEKLATLRVLPGSYQIPHDGFDRWIPTASPILSSASISHPPSPAPQVPANERDLPRTVSAVFLPTKEIIYPSGIPTDAHHLRGTFVTVHGLSEQLEGARRPGFFRGVATVVLKLFLIIEPSIAFFGQKDLQQCLLIRQLVKDLHVVRPHSIVAIPIVRESSNGLALSSRNSYLSPDEIDHAKILFTFLRQCADRLMSSESTPSIEELFASFNPPVRSITLDFISLNDPITFDPISPGTIVLPNLPIAISGAILVECNQGRTVRLIDNLVINYDLNRLIGDLNLNPRPR